MKEKKAFSFLLNDIYHSLIELRDRKSHTYAYTYIHITTSYPDALLAVQ
jgi:hypothetical protein